MGNRLIKSFLIILLIVPYVISAGSCEKSNPFHPELITDNVAIVGKIPDDIETIIDAITHPIRYQRAGAPLPKGILMLGAPGVGKTTMARFIAKQTASPIIFTSAAQFMDTCVGTGPAAIRQLFDTARQNLKDQERKQRELKEQVWLELQKKSSNLKSQVMPTFTGEVKPVIIFMDEIDSIGCSRARLRAGGSDQELRNTLNQLFTEMEGAKASENIIVIAATNEDEGFLDSALRSRFTYIAHVPLPETADRLEILRLYSAQCTFAPGVTLDYLAADEYTQGYAGRDLKKLVEHIARMAAGDKRYKDDEVAITLEHAQLGHAQFAGRKRLESEACVQRV